MTQWSAASHIGTRQHNEDAWAAHSVEAGEERWNIWAVADGLGGHEGGQLAARTAVAAATAPAVMLGDDPMATVGRGMRAAQGAVAAQIERSGLRDMSTTLVVLAAYQGRLAWGHSGDSRIYRFREGKAQLLTRDHSLAWVLATSEGYPLTDIRAMPERNQLISVLGNAEPRIEISKATNIEAGDVLLLCTDGWWDPMDERTMESRLAESATPDEWLCAMSDFIARAGDSEQDNHTALAVFFNRFQGGILRPDH